MFKDLLSEWQGIQELSERLAHSNEADSLTADAMKASDAADRSGGKADHKTAYELHARALHAHRMAAIHADASDHAKKDELVKYHMSIHDKHVDAVRDHLKHDPAHAANAEKVKAAVEKNKK